MDPKVQFMQELTDLMSKHGVTLESYHNYDGHENFCGTDYEFRHPNWTLDVGEMA